MGRVYRTAQHSLGYVRALLKGNRVRGDVSWVREGARPIVLVHGFLGTRGTMEPLAQRLRADGRAVFTYHHGTFQLDSLRRTAEALQARIQSIVEELDVDSVDLIGFSMGGLVSLYMLKFLGGERWVRRLVMLGAPVRGTWLALAGVAAVGLISPSIWQIIPHSRFLNQLLAAPVPSDVPIRQIHADEDAFCPNPGPINGIEPNNFIVLPGGHSSLVVAQPFYARIREFLIEA
ncbi:MAG: esterase/lipase family protein [Nannocystaceae bacterium]